MKQYENDVTTPGVFNRMVRIFENKIASVQQFLIIYVLVHCICSCVCILFAFTIHFPRRVVHMSGYVPYITAGFIKDFRKPVIIHI